MKTTNDLIFYNGYGGFDARTGEYVIFGEPGANTPDPWCNIVANPTFGFLTTETGSSFSWYGNSYLFRLTPRLDDPIAEAFSEKLYLKNEETGHVWGATANIVGSKIAYTTRHGNGYSTFSHEESGVMVTVTYFVDLKHPIKYLVIDLVNTTREEKRLSATYFAQPVLGDLPENTRGQIVQKIDGKHGIVSAHNPYSEIFPEKVVFVGSTDSTHSRQAGLAHSLSTDRSEFFGRDFAGKVPAALKKDKLPTGKVNSNDPGMIAKSEIRLPATSSKRNVFFLGVSEADSLHKLVAHIKEPAYVQAELESVKKFWAHADSTVQISTPDLALDTLFNQRLMYQLTTSRIWARTGFYQPGGAFGFRDQLQDMLALMWSEPAKVRKHILLSASRQFMAGDVQHWWHPPKGAGIRSVSADTHLWLVYVTSAYIRATGDTGILDEMVPYLKSQKAEPGPNAYFVPEVSDQSASLYDHCAQAIERTLYLSGKHGLPLILSGDWNDSMSNIGRDKKGESVWMGMFLARILDDFIPFCVARKDSEKVKRYRKIRKNLTQILEKSCWDGEWFLRAFWDDGSKLGTKTDTVCRIDSICQNWAVISGAVDPAKAGQAMESVNKHLIDREHGLVKLLSEPFDDSYSKDPGYIMAYPPGTRENGGAYSHAAAWTAQAYAMLGDGAKALEVLSMINPISHTTDKKKAEKYGSEPYVLAGDIYSCEPHAGRAGWTWYTGAAAVYYVTVVEHIMGFKKQGDTLTFAPCVPNSWKEFSLTYRHGGSHYRIEYKNPSGASTGVKHLIVDGRVTEKNSITLKDDAKTHLIQVVMG